ncbi:MAG: amidohydrolase family protein [Planctomycetes bacterium]|nr:amidohydrolase family protein [Planctomycetota bacterium]
MSIPLLLRGGRIAVDLLGEGGVIEDGAVLVGEDGRVAALGPSSGVSAPPGARVRVVELGGRLVLPGLVNAHTHLYSTLARGMPPLPGTAPREFVGVLERLWWPLDRALTLDDVYLSAFFGLLECARAGVTTVIDHHASQGAVAGSLEAVARAAQDVGVRLCTCFEVTDRDGPEVARAGLEENVRFARAVRADPRARGGAPTLAATFGLHASFTCGDDTLRQARDLVEREGLPGVHVHVAEDRADEEDALRRAGVRTVERLHGLGLLGSGTVAGHCVWADDAELDRLAETRTLVVTNPSSNMNNGVGRLDLARLRARGVRVALGSDGMTGDVLHELAQAYLVRRDAAADPRVGGDEAAALLGGAREVADLFFPGAGLGRLAVGGPGDLVVLDYDPWTPLDGGNLLWHVLYGGLGAKARTVVVGGRVVLDEGHVPDHDLKAMAARARAAAVGLWSRRKV